MVPSSALFDESVRSRCSTLIPLCKTIAPFSLLLIGLRRTVAS